jgi:hypothetical protein
MGILHIIPEYFIEGALAFTRKRPAQFTGG